MSRYSIYKNLVLQDERSKKLDFNQDGRKHYVYRITDLSRTIEEHYIGSRTSEKDNLIEDFWSYRTSSKYNTLNENKKEQYKIKILKVFNNPGDKILYEAFLHKFYDVKLHDSFWNKSNQTPFGFDTTGRLTVKDKDGNNISVSINDPRYLSGELVPCSKGNVPVKDKDGNNISVSINDPRYLSGELVPCSKGIKRSEDTINKKKNKVVVKDRNGDTFQVSINDHRYLSGELFGVNKNRVVVKDEDGNTMSVSINDPRYLSGELVHVNKGLKKPGFNKDKVVCKDIFKGNRLSIDVDVFEDNKRYVGMTAKYMYLKDDIVYRKNDVVKEYGVDPRNKKHGYTQISLEEAKEYLKL